MEVRNTIQKQTILQAVEALANHPTAEQVYARVVHTLPNISRATVYRNLSSMADRGLLQRMEVPGSADHYDCTLASHHHIHCVRCGMLADVWADIPLDGIDQQAAQHTDFRVLGHKLVFSGICPACKAQEN